jgi:hypothetical protein
MMGETMLVRLTRAQVLDLETRGFVFGQVDGETFQMMGHAMPQDENPEGSVPGA